MTSEKTSDKISFKEQLAYGVGALMDGGGVALMSCILTKYMSCLLYTSPSPRDTR